MRFPGLGCIPQQKLAVNSLYYSLIAGEKGSLKTAPSANLEICPNCTYLSFSTNGSLCLRDSFLQDNSRVVVQTL